MSTVSKGHAIVAEGQRRFILLGSTIARDQALPDELIRIRQRARMVDVSLKRFLQWQQTYWEHEKTGLQPPDWATLAETLSVTAPSSSMPRQRSPGRRNSQ